MCGEHPPRAWQALGQRQALREVTGLREGPAALRPTPGSPQETRALPVKHGLRAQLRHIRGSGGRAPDRWASGGGYGRVSRPGQVRRRRPRHSKPQEMRTPLPMQSPAAFPWPKKQTLAAPRKPPCRTGAGSQPGAKWQAQCRLLWGPLHPLCTRGVRVRGTCGACHLRAPELQCWAQCGGEGNPRAGPEAPGAGERPASTHSLEALY